MPVPYKTGNCLLLFCLYSRQESSISFSLIISPKNDFFKIAFHNNLDFLFWMDRLYKDTMNSGTVSSIDVCKQLISYKQRILLIGSHHLHRLLISFYGRFIRLVDIMCSSHILTELFHPGFPIIAGKAKLVSNLLQTMK